MYKGDGFCIDNFEILMVKIVLFKRFEKVACSWQYLLLSG